MSECWHVIGNTTHTPTHTHTSVACMRTGVRVTGCLVCLSGPLCSLSQHLTASQPACCCYSLLITGSPPHGKSAALNSLWMLSAFSGPGGCSVCARVCSVSVVFCPAADSARRNVFVHSLSLCVSVCKRVFSLLYSISHFSISSVGVSPHIICPQQQELIIKKRQMFYLSGVCV